jgi:radical SAM superfamily enzyme YgiQ (UPF0313 family)
LYYYYVACGSENEKVASAPDLVEEISNILDAGKDGGWLSGQTGIETGSPRLIKDHMMGKCKPFKPEDWPHVVTNALKSYRKTLSAHACS